MVRIVVHMLFAPQNEEYFQDSTYLLIMLVLQSIEVIEVKEPCLFGLFNGTQAIHDGDGVN